MLRLAVEGNGVYGFYDCLSSKEVFRISGSVFWLWGFLLRVWRAGVLSFGSVVLYFCGVLQNFPDFWFGFKAGWWGEGLGFRERGFKVLSGLRLGSVQAMICLLGVSGFWGPRLHSFGFGLEFPACLRL